ncbi:LYR motif-containing protein, partial [Thiolapillus sp.]|uniref:LYR motif-containing protein n=10 Tax=Thiolapillus sp. TaxID=2017437 RepID=UPI003AF59976
DAIEHIFWRCEHVKRFWEQLQTVVNNACANGLFVNLNESIVLFGHDCSFKSDDTFDLIILLAKFFIYKCKVKKNIPQFHLFRNYLKTAFEAYKYIAIINMSYDKFTKEWQFYKTLMES